MAESNKSQLEDTENAISTGGNSTDSSKALMVDIIPGSNLEKLLFDLKNIFSIQTEYLRIISYNTAQRRPESASEVENTNDSSLKNKTPEIGAIIGKSVLTGLLGDYAKYLLPVFDLFNQNNTPNTVNQNNTSEKLKSSPISNGLLDQQSLVNTVNQNNTSEKLKSSPISDGLLQVNNPSERITNTITIDYNQDSNLGATLISIKNFAEQQTDYLKRIVDYNTNIQNALIEQSVSSADQANIILPQTSKENLSSGLVAAPQPTAGGGSLLNDLLKGVFQGLGIEIAETALSGMLRAALPRIIPAILGPIVGILTGPVGLAALTAAVIVGGAYMLSEYQKEKRAEFIREIDKEVADGIQEIRNEKDPGFFRSTAVELGLVSPESTTEDLIGLKQTVESYRTVVPRGAGRAPLTPEQMAASQKIDWKRAEKELSPEDYKKLRGQFDKIHQDIQNPDFLYHLSPDKLDLLRTLSIRAGQDADVKLIDKVVSDLNKQSEIMSQEMGTPVYDAMNNFIGYDTSSTENISTASTQNTSPSSTKTNPQYTSINQNPRVLSSPYAVGDVTAYGSSGLSPTLTAPTVPDQSVPQTPPSVVVLPGRADRDQQGPSITNSNNTQTTIIQKTQDPAGSLMLMNQMLGGGYGDVPIFNWGY